jgi:nucleotide-binding universal stress UspA family protein
LITFALAHWITILVRQRTPQRPPPFRAPLFPLVPVVGGLACLSLAIYQGVVVPAAGLIALVWLAAGAGLFLTLFARRAQLADVSSTALDPELFQLRARSPLVLLPMANPANAQGLVAVANSLAPPQVGRVLLLSVIVAPRGWRPEDDPEPLVRSQRVLREAITASVQAGLFPETLATIAAEPWPEIVRVAEAHRCESILLGLSHLSDDDRLPIDNTLNLANFEIVVLRAPTGWNLTQVRRILVPLTGGGVHDRVLARLLASLCRTEAREITFLTVVPQDSNKAAVRKAYQRLDRAARDLWPGPSQSLIIPSDQAAATVAGQAAACDLVILGSQRLGRGRRAFGAFSRQVATATSTPLLLISHPG